MLLNSEPQRPVQRQFGDHLKCMRGRRSGRDEGDNKIGGSKREHPKAVCLLEVMSEKAMANTQFDFIALTGYAERRVSRPRYIRADDPTNFDQPTGPICTAFHWRPRAFGALAQLQLAEAPAVIS